MKEDPVSRPLFGAPRPPLRVARKESSSKRIQAAFAVLLATAFFLVWAFGEFSNAGTRFAKLAAATDVGLSGSGIWLILLLVVLFFLNALFVAGETAVDLLKPLHVKHVREKGAKGEKQSQKLQKLCDERLRYVAACKIGSDVLYLLIALVILLLSPGVVGWLSASYPEHWSNTLANVALVWIIMMAPVGVLNLIIELVPKSYAVLHPHGTALRLYRLILLAAGLFSLPASLATWVANLVTARFGGKASFALENQAEEEIKTIVESAQATGEIEVDEKEMLHSVFEFSDTVAREVMTPRVDMDALPVGSTPEQVMDLVKETGHSRIPLYEDTDDQIVGIVHAKDLLLSMLNGKAKDLHQLMRPPLFVPENKNLHELLTEMRVNRSQMAVVQDEFGGTAGLVTIEDIVEELVGEIVDEYDVEEPEIISVGENEWLVDGKTHLDDLNDAVGSEFASEEFDTVGGLVFGLFGRQPKPEDAIDSEGYRFVIAQTDGRRILKLKVEKQFEVETAQAEDE